MTHEPIAGLPEDIVVPDFPRNYPPVHIVTMLMALYELDIDCEMHRTNVVTMLHRCLFLPYDPEGDPSRDLIDDLLDGPPLDWYVVYAVLRRHLRQEF